MATISQAPVCCLWFRSIPSPGLLLFLSPFPGITGQPASALGMGWAEGGGFHQSLGLVQGIFGLLMMRFILCQELTSVLSRVGLVSTSALLREGVLVNPCFQQENTACISARFVFPPCTLTDSCSCPHYSLRLSHCFLSRTHVPALGALRGSRTNP